MRRRLPVRVRTSAFALDARRLRRGDFSDRYFLNIRTILDRLAREGYRYPGFPRSTRATSRRAMDGARRLAVGDARVEMQLFTRRRPWSVACGIEHARALIETAAGGFDARGRWRAAEGLEAWAVEEGTRLAPLRTSPTSGRSHSRPLPRTWVRTTSPRR